MRLASSIVLILAASSTVLAGCDSGARNAGGMNPRGVASLVTTADNRVNHPAAESLDGDACQEYAEMKTIVDAELPASSSEKVRHLQTDKAHFFVSRSETERFNQRRERAHEEGWILGIVRQCGRRNEYYIGERRIAAPDAAAAPIINRLVNDVGAASFCRQLQDPDKNAHRCLEYETHVLYRLTKDAQAERENRVSPRPAVPSRPGGRSGQRRP